MELYRLANNLRFAIPQELYQLEPNKVYLFIPKYGADGAIIMNMMILRDSLSMILQSNIRLNILPVDNEALIEKIGDTCKLPWHNVT